jgi:biopolymer transport protein ExbD
MSASMNEEKCEPNMTPLLDIVLQLVMFFMLCVNFVMEQVNEEVKLPTAIAAKALDRTQEYYHILNIDKKGITTH